MKYRVTRILGATALSTVSTVAFADGLDPTVLTESAVIGQISQLATVSGTTGTSAYSFAPEWSEELGFSATGSVGFLLQENSALGLIVTVGERKREVLLNFGLELDAERQIVLTAGQLQERLEFGTSADQEWVKQNEFGLAYNTRNYAFSVYHVDSETADNFVGAKSTGAELSGDVDISDAITVGFGAGYQKLEWDDGSEGVDGLTANLDLGYQANSTTRFNVFADHNMSENQFGFGGSWALGAGTLDATYTRIDGRVGAVTDDNRLAVAFTMPLGGQPRAAVSRDATSSLSVVTSPSSTLLSDVMTRPDYLPERVIVKATEGVGGSALPSCSLDVGAFRTVGSSWNGSSMDIVPQNTFTDAGYYVQIDVVIDPTIVSDRFNQIKFSNNSTGAYSFDLEGVALDQIGNGFSDTTSLLFSWVGGPSGTLAPDTLTLSMSGPNSFSSACTVQISAPPPN